MTKKDWKWIFFGIFTGFAINVIATSMSPDMIIGLVLGLIFGAVGGIFVFDKYFNRNKQEVHEADNEEMQLEEEEEEEEDVETEKVDYN